MRTMYTASRLMANPCAMWHPRFDTGALVGYWEQDDVGEEICSGTIPDGASAEYTLTDVEQLCTPDGGPLSSVDAGDGG
ncbi:MAG TPA: hypothetical protein VHO25_08875 [Polyangiaceae bacterium]|nr:hypothetical protein [Polyangiaceae bacterium]